MLALFLKDDSGAAAGEYALLLAVVCGGLACVVHYLGKTIAAEMSRAGQAIANEVETVKRGG